MIGRQTPIYKLLKSRPKDKQSLHDIRLTFIAKGLWDDVSSNFPAGQNKNDINLDPIQFSVDITVKVTVHHTDTVSVAIACSYRPLVIDIPDILYLCEILTRTEIKIAHSCEGTNIQIPRYTTWIVKLWHFGWDSLDRYDGEKFHVTFEEGIADLWRVYNKRMKDGKTKIRAEHQENPHKPVVNAIMEKFYQASYGEVM